MVITSTSDLDNFDILMSLLNWPLLYITTGYNSVKVHPNLVSVMDQSYILNNLISLLRFTGNHPKIHEFPSPFTLPITTLVR